MKKKIFLYSFILLISFGVIVFLINFYIEEKIKEKDVINHFFQNDFINQIKDFDNIELQYGGSNFHILNGLRISGIRINFPKTKETCKMDHLILQFPFLTFDTPKKMIFINLECNTISKFNLNDFLSNIFQLVLKNNLELEIYDLKLPENQYNLSKINLLFIPQKENKIKIYGKYQIENNKIEIFGTWDINNPQNRIHFNINNYKFETIKNIFDVLWKFHNYSDVFKENIKTEMIINGKGSIDITNQGYAFNLYGDFKNLKSNFLFFTIDNMNGKLNYTEIQSFKKDYNKQDWEVESSYINLTINKLFEKNLNQFNITGKLQVNNSNIKTAFNSNGNIEFRVKVMESPNRLDITPSIKLNKFILLQKKYLPVIFFKEANLYNIDNNHFKLDINGTIHSLNFNYNSTVKFNDNISPKWNIKGDFVLSETDYQKLIDLFTEIYTHYILEFKQENNLRNIDFGSSVNLKFLETNFYKIYLKNLFIDLNLSLNNPKQKNLPELKGNLNSNDTNFKIQLKGNNSMSNIMTQYLIDYLSINTYHNISLNFDLKKPEIELPLFCNTCKNMIEKIVFSYNSNGNVSNLADLYFNNSSTLKFEVEPILLQNDYRIDMMENLLNLSIKNFPQKLRINFSSFGVIFNPIQIELDNEQFNLKGYGDYNIFNSGSLNFNFYHKQKNLYRNFIIKIRKDGIWIPSYFY
jgi:hypothetical protein